MTSNQHIDADVVIELEILFQLKLLRQQHDVQLYHIKEYQESKKSDLLYNEKMNIHAK